MAYYPFNGDANDHSGNNNNPSFNNATPTAGKSGLPNTAYYFNGQNSYMQIPNSPPINFGTQFSIYALVKPTGYYEGPCHGNSILEKGYDFVSGFYLIRYDDNGFTNGQNCSLPQADTLHENLYGVYTGLNAGGYTPFMESNRWYSIVYECDGQTVKFYINCELILSAPLPAGVNFTNNYDLTLGYVQPPNLPYWLNGIIDEVRIYNRPLNVAEINTLSGACAVTPCVPNVTDFNQTQTACDWQSMQFTPAFPDSISTSQWDLGDLTTATTTTVSHTYATPGDYPVRLIVQYKGGCKDTITKDIPVFPPTVSSSIIATQDTTLCSGQQIVLNGLGNLPYYCWSPASTLSGTSVGNPTATPSTTTTYYCT
ncbi:MAG TPA: LamG-like jellyroll fold domain-containing protein [Chitinophagaceae bacterium]